MGNFPKDFRHIGVIDFELNSDKGENIITQEMVLLFNTNYLTAEEAFDKLRKNEYSDYIVAMPKSVFLGLFKNTNFYENPYGIVS